MKKNDKTILMISLAMLWGLVAFLTAQFGMNYLWVYIISGFILTPIIIIKNEGGNTNGTK